MLQRYNEKNEKQKTADSRQKFHIPDRELENGFIKLINEQEWDWWCTFTTGYKMTLGSARRSMERLNDRLNENVSPANLAWFGERYETKEGYHTHGFLKLFDRSLFEPVVLNGETVRSGNVGFDLVRKSWQIVTKGQDKYNRIHLSEYNPKKGAAGYCVKYVTKGFSDWDIYMTQKKTR